MKNSTRNSVASPKPPAPPVFIAQAYKNGVHSAVVRAPQFEKHPRLLQTSIVRVMLHNVRSADGKWALQIVRSDILDSGAPGELDGKLIVDDLMPGGLFVYAAVAHYQNGKSQQTYSPAPVLIP